MKRSGAINNYGQNSFVLLVDLFPKTGMILQNFKFQKKNNNLIQLLLVEKKIKFVLYFALLSKLTRLILTPGKLAQ